MLMVLSMIMRWGRQIGVFFVRSASNDERKMFQLQFLTKIQFKNKSRKDGIFSCRSAICDRARQEKCRNCGF